MSTLKMNEQQQDLLKRRYFQSGENWSKLCRRVAKAIASVEKDKKHWEEVFYGMIYNGDFLPNTPTLVNAGVVNSLSACYVVGIKDSLDGIVGTAHKVSRIQKFGGGTGCDYSRVRPSCLTVGSTGGYACGPCGAIRAVNSMSEVFQQGCKRDGANMASLSVEHPDIVKFIHLKKNEGDLSNVNISVVIPEDFTQKKMSDIHEVKWYDTTNKVVLEGYLDINGEFTKHKNKKVLTIGNIVDMIVEGMWRNGEPGVIFMGRINACNPITNMIIRATNPCGEQPLLEDESCNLGSINLYNMIVDGRFDFDKLGNTVKKGIRFLDDVIDVNVMPDSLKEIEETTKKYRKIGLGPMGFADTLYALGIKYGSDESYNLAREIMSKIDSVAEATSIELGEEKGSFPEIKNSIYKGKKMRNATRTTIAPTGSIAQIAGVSPSIEPIFHKETRIKATSINKEYLIRSKGYDEHKDDWPQDIFIETHDVNPIQHLHMQSVFQEHVNNAVSKTINVAKETKREEILEILLQAFGRYKNIKGLTVYRDGSRKLQAQTGANGDSSGDREIVEEGVTFKKKVACGQMYITINQSAGKEINEVFATIGKGGSCNYSFLESINRLISIALQNNVPLRQIIKQLKGIRCSSVGGPQKGGAFLSCSDAIARTLMERYEALNKKRIRVSDDDKTIVQLCPDCGSPVLYETGCKRCANVACGWKAC